MFLSFFTVVPSDWLDAKTVGLSFCNPSLLQDLILIHLLKILNAHKAMRFFHALAAGCVPVIVGAPKVYGLACWNGRGLLDIGDGQTEVGGSSHTIPLPFAEVGLDGFIHGLVLAQKSNLREET